MRNGAIQRISVAQNNQEKYCRDHCAYIFKKRKLSASEMPVGIRSKTLLIWYCQ